MKPEEHHSGGLPQLDFDTWPSQILWLLITFGTLYFLMKTFAIPRLASTIEEREATISRDLDRARDFDQRANVAKASYETSLAATREEARQVLEKTKKETEVQLREALAQADQRIASEVQKSEERLASIRDTAAAQMQIAAQDTTTALVQRFGMDNIDPANLRNSVERHINIQLKG